MFLKNKINLPESLAVRLTIWYGLIFTLSLGAAFFFLYFVMNTVLLERTDRELLNQAGTFHSIFKAKGLEAVKRVMILEAQAGGEQKIFFRLLSLDGFAFSSSNMADWEDMSVKKGAVQQLVSGQPHVFDRVVAQGRQIRVYYGGIGRGIVLQIGREMESAARFGEAFKQIYIGIMLGMILPAVFAGWFMARKALSGLETVTRTAMHISADELKQRVKVKGQGSEIERLAVTFNQMLDRIEKLVTGIREMSDNMAHDLKSPVTRIRGLAEITLTTAGSLDDYQAMAGETVEQCDRLLDMVNTTLMISRTEAGAMEINVQKVDLGKLVQQAGLLFQPVAEDKGVHLSWAVTDGCKFQGDLHLLQRLVGNLLDNAVKYTQFGGAVFMMLTSLQRGVLEIAVEDTGIGISEADRLRIFERFYRCDPSRSETGSGLGLSLVEAIASVHGAKIHVDSSEGEGTAFYLELHN
jgi:heavy metal sensor kinase